MDFRTAPKPWVVQKYGGTSLGKLLDKVCGTIIPSYLDRNNVAVVCSALSGATKATGTTSLLLDCLQYAEGVGMESIGCIDAAIDSIRDAHLNKLHSFRAYSSNIGDSLLNETAVSVVNDCEETRKFLLAAQVVGDLSPRTKDRVLSLGERLACNVVAAALTIKGIPARVINLDNIVASLPDQEAEFERLGTGFYHRLSQKIGSIVSESTDAVPIITGFFGLMPNSLLRCVGRGYSDLCGAMCAAGLNAIEYQIWKEVDGIFTADPRKVPSARVLATVTAEEAAELTFFGSEVIHPLTMEQLYKSGVVLRLKNVFNPSGSGTVIYPSAPKTDCQVNEVAQECVSFMLSNGYHGQPQSRRRPTAITNKEGLTLINVAYSRTAKSQSFLTSIFSQLERNSIVPDLVTTSERNVSLAIQASNDKLARDLQEFGSVTILENMNIVSVIGQRMRNMVGTANIFGTIIRKNQYLHDQPRGKRDKHFVRAFFSIYI
ncbi:aspartate kinase, putative [Talaromyces stipitatus ATCC 10500]|uniref:Aspartokinase n=1 Tax=Talaromyces stipitatus (strain ATCC 10500 / CBS 375.48 / QM 6759 / NRRL 1006) TaxID=441959 RepID=B8MN44_TALSN|nr:aspartate kinase, putative [Talaromyces stipitatus ATCC 10500]EED13993.1 aspartate kinase, putative [Talaromyces stipitatus ATCC 10500]